MSNSAIIYCRVSSVAQTTGPGHVSLANQESECREYCGGNFIPVMHVVSEVSSARSTDGQPALQKIVRTIQPDQVLVFYSISRFSRNTLQGLTLIKKIQQKGAKVYSVTENCSYENSSDINLFNITLVAAETESHLISDRVRASVRFRRKRGDYFGKAPFGQEVFRTDTGIRKIKQNPSEQKVIRIIRAGLAKWSPTEVARRLNDKGYRRRGRLWTAQMINYITRREAVAVFSTKELQNALPEADEPASNPVQRSSTWHGVLRTLEYASRGRLSSDSYAI
jgi:site-specific DNA recombinase